MAWERRGTRRYFYISRRDPGGRVVKQYVGAGAKGARAATSLAVAKAQRQLDRIAVMAERARLRPLDRLVAEFADAADFLLAATLLAAGYHRHRRGRWRRRRERPQHQ
jgi:hypothetical protein